jgi:hypothetical protein
MPTERSKKERDSMGLSEYRNEYNSYPLGYSTHLSKAPHDDVEAIGIVK